MFKAAMAFSSFSVDDLEKARNFYGDTLGLKISDVEMRDMPREYWPLALQAGGGNDVMIYPKPDHKPATFTVLNFPVARISKRPSMNSTAAACASNSTKAISRRMTRAFIVAGGR